MRQDNRSERVARDEAERTWSTRMLALLGVVVAVLASVAAGVPVAAADQGPRYHAVDADGAHDGGVFYRRSAHWNDTSRQPGVGVYYGESVQLVCGTSGDAVGPYQNRRWHLVDNVSRPGAGRGWVPDRYLDTPNAANQATPGEPECSDATLAVAPVPATTINGHNVGYPQNGWHRWGSCTVRDYKGGDFDWTVASNTAGLHIVHNGMLWGWFDNGGAAKGLGCPTTDEYDWNTGVRQDFQGGSLFWHPGMNRAALTSPVALQAISWAASHQGQHFLDGACLVFVHDAYGSAGRDIGRGESANSYAVAHRGSLNPSTTPPPGALVFWWGTPGYEDGHVALSVGGGYALSTGERDDPNVHVLSIAERNAYPKPYAGWLMP